MTTARARRVLPALLIVLATGWPSAAMAAGLPKVPDDFEVRLVANVPSFLYACQVAAAPDGALYVAVDPMDQVGPYESHHGKIYVYREGKEPVLFAEGFRAIFGMAWYEGALYVSHMPFLSVVRDTDGDGKADDRKDLFKDLGITNNKGLNDHIVSGIQFGIDNRLYISTGDKGVLKATGPDGKTAQVVGGGTLRCKPDGTEIEVFSTGTRNHLEPNLDDRDNLFTYDNTDDGDGWWTRVTHHVDGGYYGYPYDYHDHPDRFLNRIAEFGGGSPCGGVVYKEDAWPEKYRNRVFWSEWGKKKIQGVRLRARRGLVQDQGHGRLRRARRFRRVPPARLLPLLRRQDPLHRRLGHGLVGLEDREGRPGLRRHLQRPGDPDPPPRHGLRPARPAVQAARPPLVERADEGPAGDHQGRQAGLGEGHPDAGRPRRLPAGQATSGLGRSTGSPGARPTAAALLIGPRRPLRGRPGPGDPGLRRDAR